MKRVWRSMWNSISIHYKFTRETSFEVHMKKYVKLLVNFYCHSLWSYMWNLMWSTCENVYERDWIVSHSFHISHVKYTWKNMWNWKWTSTAIDVNLYVKPHVKYMWKCVWKGLHCFTPFSHNFHIYFTMLNFTHIWNMCVKYMWKAVKNMWKVCENDTFFTHFFTGFFTYILLVVIVDHKALNFLPPW